MYREKAVINVINTFGTYLGTVAQPNLANISTWTAVVATEKLEDIPLSVMMVAGPVKQPVQVRPVNWKKGAVFREEDFPQPPQKFTKPPKPIKEKQVQLVQPEDEDEDDLFPISRRVLFEICKGRDLDTLPGNIRAVITGEDRAGSATQLVVTNNRAPDPATGVNDETGHRLLQSSPISPKLLTRESHSTSNAVTNPAGPCIEEQEIVRGINCSVGEGSLWVQLPPTKQKETFPREVRGTEGVPELESEGADFQSSFNATLRLGEGPQMDLEPLKVLRRSVRQRKRNNTGLFKKVLGRPKEIMGYTRRDQGAGPSKRPAAPKGQGRLCKRPVVPQKERKIELIENSAGFFQINVPYTHCQEVADGCGLRPQDVITNIEEDNIQRMAAHDLAMQEGEEERAEQEREMEDGAVSTDSDMGEEEETRSDKV